MSIAKVNINYKKSITKVNCKSQLQTDNRKLLTLARVIPTLEMTKLNAT